MSVHEEVALLNARLKLKAAETYAHEFADAVRRLISAPLGSQESRDAVIRCKAALEAYDEDRADVVTAKTVESASRPS